MLSPRLTGYGLLLIFVAGIVCLCGVMEYQHFAPAGTQEPQEAHSAVVQPGSAGDPGGATGVIYTVTFFVASLGVVVGLLLGTLRRRSLIGVAPVCWRPPPLAASVPPHIPARSRLQVFLL